MFEFRKVIQNTLDDYTRFNEVHNRIWRIKPIYIWILSALLTIYALVLDTNLLTSTSLPILIFLFLIIFIANLAVLFLVKFLVSKLNSVAYKKAYEKIMTKDKSELLIDKSGIKLESTEQVIHIPWSYIKKLVCTNEAIYIYHKSNAAVILPLRYIHSPDEMFGLKSFIERQTKTNWKYIYIR